MGHYIMIKGSVQQEDITVVNIYAPNIGAPRYIKQMLLDLKGEKNSSMVIVGDFSTSLSELGRSAVQRISKNCGFKPHFTPNGPDWYLQNILSSSQRIHIVLISTWIILQGRPTSLNKFFKTKIISCIFLDQNGIKLDIHKKRNFGNYINTRKLNSMLPNNYWVNEDTKNEIKKFLTTNGIQQKQS